VPIGERPHDHALLAPERATDLDLVPDMQYAMRLRGLTIHVELAALAGFLRLGPRSEQAGDVEPDIEADARRFGIDHWRHRFYSLPARHPEGPCVRRSLASRLR